MSENKTIKVYRDAGDPPLWRWQKWTSSDITGDSGQGYDSRSAALAAAEAEAEGTDYEVVVQEPE